MEIFNIEYGVGYWQSREFGFGISKFTAYHEVEIHLYHIVGNDTTMILYYKNTPICKFNTYYRGEDIIDGGILLLPFTCFEFHTYEMYNKCNNLITYGHI